MFFSMTASYASSSNNAISLQMSYYGRLNDIAEFKYYEEFKVVLFECDWVDVTKGRGVMEDGLGFTLEIFHAWQILVIKNIMNPLFLQNKRNK